MWGLVATGIAALASYEWWDKTKGPAFRLRRQIEGMLAQDVKLNHAPVYPATLPGQIAETWTRGVPGEVMGLAIAIRQYPITANWLSTRLVAPPNAT